jgi:hypothetical protein
MPKDFVIVANWDRALRIVVGLVMVYLGWFGTGDSLWSAALRIFGFLPLLTGVVGWDPVYALLGWKTRPLRYRR